MSNYDTSHLPPTQLRTTEETSRAMYPPETRPGNIHESIDRALAVMYFQRKIGVGPWATVAATATMTPKDALNALATEAQELGIYDE